MFYLSLREVLLRNASGTHDMIMPANEATFVVPRLYDAANAAGCVPCDKNGQVIQPGASAPAPAPVAPSISESGLDVDPDAPAGHTSEQVVDAVRLLIATNDKTKFSAGTGRPKVGAVSEIVGEKVSLAEIEGAWQDIEAEVSEED